MTINYPQSSCCNIFWNCKSYRGLHVAHGLYVVQVWYRL